ncbi:amidophosphoribosyltransferase [Myxococcota bacterium]|nr:amidophosphoribosyltransferase [Myxococcota bacterium]
MNERLDAFHEECGVFAVWGHADAARLAYLGLHALQHRGQEGAGIVASDGERLSGHRGVGLVTDVFDEQALARLPGQAAIGHNRYSTAGGADPRNVQPFLAQSSRGGLAVAHNGNLVNAGALREHLESQGAIFQATSDTEIVLHLVARSTQRTLVNRLVDALGQVRGAYSLLVLAPDRLIAVRDPHGFRPMVLGRLGSAHVIASETCAFDLIEAEPVREVQPGEMLIVDADGLVSFRPLPRERTPRPCVFEHVYFSRPDSVVFGHEVYAARRAMGARLADEQPADCDVVVPVPDSGVPAAMGYAERLGRPFHLGLIRSHYVGRTFIQPSQAHRDLGVRLKLNPVRGVIEGRRVAVIDDSLVRGTTCRKIVRLLRRAGAAEVHVRIAAPPTTGPCYYGVDTPSREELLAATRDHTEIAMFLEADSVGYLSLAGMHDALHGGRESFCDACFSGEYPVRPTDARRPPQLPLFRDR